MIAHCELDGIHGRYIISLHIRTPQQFLCWGWGGGYSGPTFGELAKSAKFHFGGGGGGGGVCRLIRMYIIYFSSVVRV